MQQVQQREVPERISWARAMIFGVGFFFIAAILVGQLPGYIFSQMTAASLVQFEQGTISLALTSLGGFMVIQAIVMLFDPKPVVPPVIFSILGVPLALAGLALVLWAAFSGNEYFPSESVSWNPVLNGKVLWLQANAVDLTMVGLVILFVGVAWVFYSVLARREQSNPDRSDRGTTPAIRGMIITSIMLLIIFMVSYTIVNDNGLAFLISPTSGALQTQLIIDTVIECVLGLAFLLILGAFALRFHYLMRPVRKRTMAPLYAIGALGLAQTGVLLLLIWFFIYPLINWMHSWTFIGLGDYLTICAKKTAIPQSCAFSPDAGYIIDAVVTTNSFALLMAAVFVWKSNRNLVIIGGVTITAVLGLATLLMHTNPNEVLVALLLSGAMLVLATIWTSVARREFAVVGENNLGCLGMWLVVGTCLLIYLASFAFFSLPNFPNETAPNIPFISGTAIPAHPAPNTPPTPGDPHAIVMMVLLGGLAAIQFYFLVRNRYKV
ncbi:MAG TPA: hypothetical protein VK140_02865 [Ktedonobacteraceae bacterium]|nr:hypothetical protein [Ktedonobacteraceae bacterium]